MLTTGSSIDRSELHQQRSLIPVDVHVIELVAAEADDGDSSNGRLCRSRLPRGDIDGIDPVGILRCSQRDLRICRIYRCRSHENGDEEM
jgi:hypothetical protein